MDSQNEGIAQAGQDHAGQDAVIPQRRTMQNHIPTDHGMQAFHDYLRSRVDLDSAILVDRVIARWRRIHGNRVIENPTKDYVALLRTYRAMAALGTDGRLKTTEVVRVEDFSLFATSEAEREAVLSETKWNDGGQFLVNIPGKGISSLSRGTWLDSDGSNMRERHHHAMRVMTLLLNVEFRTGDCPSFLMSGDEIKGTSDGQLRRMTEDTEAMFRKAWDADIACYLEAKKKFISFLDPSILNVMTHAKIKDVSGYNWFRGMDALPEHSASMSQARLMLVSAFPLMQAAFRDNGDLTMQDFVEKIAEDVRLGVISNERQMMALVDDSGDRIVCQALAKYYDVLPAQVLNFRGVRPDDIGIEDTLPASGIRNLLRTAPTFPGHNDVEPEERRRIIRASFLASAFETEISQFATNVSLQPPVGPFDENSVKEAMRLVGDVSAWLTTMVKIPIEALRSENGSRRSMPNMLGLVLGNMPLDVAANRVINLSQMGQRIIDSMQSRFAPRVINGRAQYTMARDQLEWSSMFRQPTHFMVAGRVRVLTTEHDIDLIAHRLEALLPSAAGRAFSSILNYVEISDLEGEVCGMIAVNPEILRNSAPFETSDSEARWVLRRWCLKGKEDVVAGCINDIRRLVSDDPEIINLRRLRAERNERMAMLGEAMQCSVSENDSSMQLLIYNNRINWLAPNALRDFLAQLEEYLPDGLRGFHQSHDPASVRDDFLRTACAYEEEIRRKAEDNAQVRHNNLEEAAASISLQDEFNKPDSDEEEEGIDCSLPVHSDQDDLTIACSPEDAASRKAMLMALREAAREGQPEQTQTPPRPSSSPSPSM